MQPHQLPQLSFEGCGFCPISIPSLLPWMMHLPLLNKGREVLLEVRPGCRTGRQPWRRPGRTGYEQRGPGWPRPLRSPLPPERPCQPVRHKNPISKSSLLCDSPERPIRTGSKYSHAGTCNQHTIASHCLACTWWSLKIRMYKLIQMPSCCALPSIRHGDMSLTEWERHAAVEDFWVASRTSLALSASRTPSAFSRAAAQAALADCTGE